MWLNTGVILDAESSKGKNVHWTKLVVGSVIYDKFWAFRNWWYYFESVRVHAILVVRKEELRHIYHA
jgi:hypothetical protein